MILDEFNESYMQLQLAFEHRVKNETARQYWQRLSGYSAGIWKDAAELMISKDERFPRISRCLGACEEIHFERKRQEAMKRNPGSWSSTADVILAIPFPTDLKDALKAKMDGMITQEQLEQVCRAHEPESSCPYRCIDGWVRYWKDVPGHGKRSFTVKCHCIKGQAVDEPGPSVDYVGLPSI